ncbi:HesB/IscA family protein [Candidatus Vondammii sp. HM_W22]|uniref:HesB/IscA family protein n=1 Tax=Candidatus Vondammii sp. HM_W22 TaxID=2687299 RepID=UPI001F12F460|nr:iron-sulfur cluster assembly accessory protein [Candidatus Vondammii sp. HM_W22]
MFKITDAAAKQIQIASKQGGTEGIALRMAVRKNGDESLDYLMGFDEMKDDDIVEVYSGIQVVMAPEFAPRLDQTVMDYLELENGDYSFVFHNPQDPNYVPPEKSDE